LEDKSLAKKLEKKDEDDEDDKYEEIKNADKTKTN
jgi:hypothetical protein